MLLAGVALTALAYNRLVLLKYPWTHGILDAEEDDDVWALGFVATLAFVSMVSVLLIMGIAHRSLALYLVRRPPRPARPLVAPTTADAPRPRRRRQVQGHQVSRRV